MAFVHLHLHTEFSLLDGSCRIRDIPEYCKALGQTAVAITDHGVMYGCIDFYKACKAAGIKPIIGCEVYVAPRTMKDRVHGMDNEAHHLVLLCENETGYRNLSYMVSMAFVQGFYVKPRVDKALLREHSEGLIALSACLAGSIPRLLAAGDYEGAKAEALELSDIFGPEHFYLELQNHGIPLQSTVNAGVLRLAEECHLPLVASNDAHYLKKSDAAIQDVLMCIQMGKTVDDPDRMRFESDEFYMKSEEEMRALFGEHPEALENTQKIADRCNLDFVFNQYHLPAYPVPEAYNNDSYFRMLCEKGFAERYPDAPQSYRDRMEYEIGVISRMGYVNYYLIVWDFIHYAKKVGIPVGPGRGSGAASIVAYCLHITEIDPMKYALIFERFLNPERVSMPDFDTDFCQERRGEVIDYVTRKYGSDHVAQIVTFGTLAARAAIRDVGRALDFSFAETDVVAKLIPSAPHMTLAEALKISPQLKEKYDGDPKVKNLVDTAMALEGMPRNTSTHAAGVVITEQPVHTYVPLSRNEDTVVTQYTMTTIEELGLLKMDFLGLRNLTIIQNAEEVIRKNNPSFSMKDIPVDDSEVYKMLGEGKTSGVFQMESAGMTGVCVQMKPGSIEDLTAIVALYRPGPMDSIPTFISNKMNPSLITYKTPQLEPILKVTYGCMVYQEQVIEIFRRLGGYTLGQADNMRRAISKKKQAVIVAERQTFVHGDESRGIPGAVKNGVSEEAANSIYDEILDFANYAFNKAHAVCYAKIAYDTAYLKCHYPKEYMAALMTSVMDSPLKLSAYTASCKDSGIAILPPDVNESEDGFTSVREGIRFGLCAVKNIGRGLIQRVVAEREAGGKFLSFEDFCRRTSSVDLNKRAVENLIKCGALDCLGLYRSQLLEIYEAVLDSISQNNRKNVDGQLGFFDFQKEEDITSEIPAPQIPELPLSERMRLEKESAGIYFSGHPMDDYRPFLKGSSVVPIIDLLEAGEGENGNYHDEQMVSVAGIIESIKQKTTKNNSVMAYVTLEDDTGSIETILFSNVLSNYGARLKENAPAIFCGRLSLREDKDAQIVVNSILPIDSPPGKHSDLSAPNSEKKEEKLYLRLPTMNCRESSKARAMVNMFPGNKQAVFYFADTKQRALLNCSLDASLLAELRSLLGAENVVLR